MNWQVLARPEVEGDIAAAAQWYDGQQFGLGADFELEVFAGIVAISLDPEIGCVRHRSKAIRWRYPLRFPYRIIYSVDVEQHIIVIVAVLHGARADRHWRRRIR